MEQTNLSLSRRRIPPFGEPHLTIQVPFPESKAAQITGMAHEHNHSRAQIVRMCVEYALQAIENGKFSIENPTL